MQLTRLTWACAMAAVLAAPAGALAHPHVWTTVETEIVYADNQMVTGLRHKWTFDEFYSAFASQGLDQDGDGDLSREELQPLADENIESLVEFDYFTFVTVDGQPAPLKAPEDAWLEHLDGLLSLHFTLPLQTPIDARLGDLAFSVYDPTFYIAFSLAEDNPVRLAASAPAPCRPRLSEPEEADMEDNRLSEAFFGSLGADSDFGATFAPEVRIDCTAP